ncbi:hypothetical protein D3C78_1017520 [compost metagenome]
MHHLGCRQGRHRDFGRTRGTEAALNQGHHLTILQRSTQYLADRLAFTQDFHFEADGNTGLGRTDKGNRQRAHRAFGRHFRAHGFVLQRGHQTTETGAALPPLRRYHQLIRRVAHGVE